MSQKTKNRQYDIVLDNGVVAHSIGNVKFTCTIKDITNYNVSIADRLLTLGAQPRTFNKLCEELQKIFKAKVIDIT